MVITLNGHNQKTGGAHPLITFTATFKIDKLLKADR